VTTLFVVWLGAFLVVPGAGAVLALFPPGRIGVVTRVALVFGLGYAITGGVAYVLTVLHAMRPVPYFVLVALATVACWVVALRRSTLRAHARAILDEVRADPWPLAIGAVVLLVVAVVRTTFLRNLPIIAPFRYWVDGLEIADAGRIPAFTLHYGAPYAPATSKVFLNAFTAGTVFATGADAVRALPALLWVGSMGLIVAMWASGRELGLRFTAPLLPVLAMVNRTFLSPELTIDLSSYKAEVMGRLVAVAALALGLVVLRERGDRTKAVVAGALLAVAAATHLVPFLVVVIVLGWFAVARLILEHRQWRGLVRAVATTGAVAAVLAGALLLLPKGDIGFQGAETPGGYNLSRGFDETQYLYTGHVLTKSHPTPGGWYIPPGRVASMYVARALGLPPASRFRSLVDPMGPILLVGGLILAVAMLLWFPKDLRPIGLTAWGLGLSLIAVALFFSYRYDVYVPAWFGVRRMFDQGAIPIILAGLAAIEAGLVVLARWRPKAGLAAGCVVALLVTGLIAPRGTMAAQPASVRAEVVEFVDWVRANIPCDARLLTNERTVGFIRAMTGRASILEGMGPFLRPDMLDQVVDLTLGARGFYTNPEGSSAYLEQHGVTHVLVLKAIRLGFPGPVVQTVDPALLRDVPFLEPMYSSPVFDAYRVVGLTEATGFPKPQDYPGYTCWRDPISIG
jgi:hypothetical protein